MSAGRGGSFLPKVANATPKDGNSPPSTVPGLIGANQIEESTQRTAVAPHFFLSAEDRLRNLLYEREQESQRLRQENAVLRQLERRQQKEIDLLESTQEEAPRVIRALREELASFKLKVKEMAAQKSVDDRALRQQAESIRTLKEKSSKMKQLLRAKDLEERQNLRDRLDVERLRYEELDRSEKEIRRRMDLLEKNFLVETRQLRGKLLSSDRENLFYKEKCAKLEETLRDRDKQVASLSIYRYNAVHKKADGVCKVCKKKKKEEEELRRKDAVIAKLPIIPPPKLEVVGTDSVSVQFFAPISALARILDSPSPIPSYGETAPAGSLHDQSEGPLSAAIMMATAPTPSPMISSPQFEYTHIKITYWQVQSQQEMLAVPHEDMQCNSMIVPLNQIEEPFTKVLVHGLIPGAHYSFEVTAARDDIEGPPSKVESILVDIPPSAPLAPQVKQIQIESGVAVELAFSQATNSIGSKASALRIYHSSGTSHEQAVSSAFRAVAEVDPEDTSFTFTVEEEIGLYHSFRIAAVNTAGEGPLSESSEAILVDIIPNPPVKPTVRKLTTSSVNLSFNAPSENHGTDIIGYKILYYRLESSESQSITEEKPRSGQEGSIQRPYIVLVNDPRKFNHVISGLEPGTRYIFHVAAFNHAGEGQLSEPSEEVCLDHMLQEPPPPILRAVDPATLEITLDGTQVAGRRGPTVTGYNVAYARDPQMLVDRVVITNLLAGEDTIMVEDLEYGGIYWVSYCLVAGSEEGPYGDPGFVALAAGIPLPPSPPPPSEMHEPLQPLTSQVPISSVGDDEMIPISSTDKLLSRSRDLSQVEKSRNMHRGLPAEADQIGGLQPSDSRTSLNEVHNVPSVAPPTHAIAKNPINGSLRSLSKTLSNSSLSSKAVLRGPASPSGSSNGVASAAQAPQLAHLNSQQVLTPRKPPLGNKTPVHRDSSHSNPKRATIQ